MKFTPEDRDMTFQTRWDLASAKLPKLVSVATVSTVLISALTLMLGCTSTPQPTVLSPQTITSGPAEEVSLAEPAAAEPEATDPTAPVTIQPGRSAEPKRRVPDETTILVAGSLDTPGPADDRSRLRIAAQREKDRRAQADRPVAVITDENLSEMAEGARVTMGSAPEVDAETQQAIELSEELKEQEIYWRTRAREVRREWRDAYDSIQELEQSAEELRTKFYAADDPAYRDREVKPAWDRALDRLDEARRGVDRAKEKLAALQDEGRRAGAMPGWLREGADIQPPELVDDEFSEADPTEPKIIKN